MDELPSRIGRFELTALLGRGGMGAVYDARDPESGEPVAIKIVADASVDLGNRLAREARILQRLDDPAIVRLREVGRFERGVFLVMDRLEGEDLARRLARSGVTPREALALVRRVALALANAHASGIVHRDIKPANLFLERGDVERVKILDFGVARDLGADSTLTAPGALIGTAGYMAPEQASGAPLVDARADVFSLGCVLFECLTGRRAFEGDQLGPVLARILHEEPGRVSEARPEIGAAFDRLVARMLAKDPRDRLADASEVVREIDPITLEDEAHDRPARPVIGGDEQRVVTVLVAVFGEENDAPLRVSDSEVRAVESVQAIVGRMGGELAHLATGALELRLPEVGAPRDRASRLARAAMTIREAVPRAVLSLATGRSTSGVANAIDLVRRACEALDRACAGTILLDGATADLVRLKFLLRASTNGGWELIAALDELVEERRVLGRPTPFVGRDRELRTVLGLVGEALEERSPRAALIIGPAGSGKSRTLREILLARPELPRWVARADAPMGGAPFGIVSSLVRSALDLRVDDEAPVVRSRAREALQPLAPDEAVSFAEFLVELLAPEPHPSQHEVAAARGDSLVMAARVRAAFVALVHASARSAPLLLLVEDAHWSDEPSARAIADALATAGERAIVCFATLRPEGRAIEQAWTSRFEHHVRLGAIAPRAAVALARAVWIDAEAVAIERVVERAAGNPLLLEELLRRGDVDGDALSSSVHALVQARLASEAPEDRRVLRAASVFGETSWREGIAALTGLSSNEVGERLACLASKEWLVERVTSRFGDTFELAFRHALVRDATYAMLTESDRQVAHGLAADWLIGVGEHDSKAIALHLELAERRSEAVPWRRRAAQAAIAAADFNGAVEEARLGIFDGAEREELAFLRLVEGESLGWLGHVRAASEVITTAIPLLAPGTRAWIDGLGWLGILRGMLGDSSTAQASVAALQEHCRQIELDAQDVFLRTVGYVMTTLFFAGDPARAASLWELARTTTVGPGGSVIAWRRFCELLSARFLDGDLWNEISIARRALAELDQRYAVLRAHFETQLGHSLNCVGRFEEALACSARSLETTRRVEAHLFLPQGFGLRAIAAACHLPREEALPLVEEAWEATRDRADEIYGLYGRVQVACALRALGFADRAAEILEAVAGVAELWGIRSYALGTLAAARLDQGRVLDALGALHRMASLNAGARLRGGHDLEVRATSIRVLRAAGLVREADRALERARAIVERYTADASPDHLAAFYRSPLLAGITPRGS